jgi:hypothetical protein
MEGAGEDLEGLAGAALAVAAHPVAGRLCGREEQNDGKFTERTGQALAGSLRK